MRSFILRESEYVTFPYLIIQALKSYISSLNWRISNTECYGKNADSFILDNGTEHWLSGAELINILEKNQDVQWVWGLLSGFSQSVSKEKAYGVSTEGLFDGTGDLPIWTTPVRTINPLAEIEIVAIDSSETFVVTDNEEIIRIIKDEFSKCEEVL